jgi:hypothetical protein
MSTAKMAFGFTFDPGIVTVLGERKYSSYMEALNEAIQNSIDNRAANIDIKIEQDRIVIEDDGNGMSLSVLQDEYLRIGRPNIDPRKGGLFGIGCIANQALSHKTEIVTHVRGQSRGIRVLIHWDQVMNAPEIDARRPDAYTPAFLDVPSQPEKHGTTIILTDLKYKTTDPLEFKTYTEKKRFPLLISPDQAGRVRISINGQQCAATEPVGAEVYEFDSTKEFVIGEKTLPPLSSAHFGRVWGKFYITDPDEANTTHVFDRVGQRLDHYAEKDWLRITSLRSGMAFKRRLLGVINTTTEEIRGGTQPQPECLLLKSDRSGFFEDTLAFKQLVAYLNGTPEDSLSPAGGVLRAIHDHWLKNYKNLPDKGYRLGLQEAPNVVAILHSVLQDEHWIWKRDPNGVEREVVRKHEPHTPKDRMPRPRNKMLQCPQCKAINYISISELRIYVENPSPEARRKMSKNWPCKVCGNYLDPEKDTYRRPSPPKKPGEIMAKVKLGAGKVFDLRPESLGKAGELAYYDPDTEQLLVNADHSFYVRATMLGHRSLRQHMVLAALYAIAQMRKREENAAFEPEFNRLCSLAHQWTERGPSVVLEEPED